MEALARVYEEEGLALPDWVKELAPDGEMIARILEGLLAYDWVGRALPERITVPTLILVGEQEDPGREAEAAAAAMPDGQAVYFAGLGHVGVWPGRARGKRGARPPVPPSRAYARGFIASLRRIVRLVPAR